MTTLRIGTRGSPLALWQAHTVAAYSDALTRLFGLAADDPAAGVHAAPASAWPDEALTTAGARSTKKPTQ